MAECQFQGQVRRRTRSCYNGSQKVQIQDCGSNKSEDIHICKVPLPSPIGKAVDQPQRNKKSGDLVEIDNDFDQIMNSSKINATSRTNDGQKEQPKKEFVILNLEPTTTSPKLNPSTLEASNEAIDMEDTTMFMPEVSTISFQGPNATLNSREATATSSATSTATQNTNEVTVPISSEEVDEEHTTVLVPVDTGSVRVKAKSASSNESDKLDDQTTTTRPYPIKSNDSEELEEPQYETLIYEYFEPPDTTERPVTRPNYNSIRWWYTYFLLRFFS